MVLVTKQKLSLSWEVNSQGSLQSLPSSSFKTSLFIVTKNTVNSFNLKVNLKKGILLIMLAFIIS